MFSTTANLYLPGLLGYSTINRIYHLMFSQPRSQGKHGFATVVVFSN